MGFMITQQQYRNRKTGKISASYIDILPKVLTLNRQFKPSRKNLTTPFQETELLPIEKIMNSEMKSVFAERPSTIKMIRVEFCKKLILRLKEVISENWDSKAINIVMHSSGIDSRMLSWLIKRLHNERGNDWLGRVIFICSNPEVQSFKSIVRYIGWRGEQCFSPNERQGITYSSILSDFKSAWQKCSGTWMYPINMFYYLPLLALKHHHLSTDRVHFWTGLCGNEFAPFASADKGGHQLAHQCKYLYYLGDFSARPAFGNRYIKPFTDLEYLRLIVRSTARLGCKNFRNVLLETMDPKLLGFRNLNAAGHAPYHLPEKALHTATHRYERSWYGRKIHQKLAFPKWNSKKDYWHSYFSPLSHWGLASLCEHLLEKGYKIK